MHRTTASPARARRAARPVAPGGKRKQAADDALAQVLGLFESGELPDRIAQTVIARQGGDTVPMASWSLGNQLLTLMAGTSDARGFRQWEEVGRHVKRGARAFYILGPCKRSRRELDEQGEEVERTYVAGFVGVPVFRYEDTEGAELERPDYRPAEFPPLYDVAERLGVAVRYAPFVAKFRGRYQYDSRGREEIVLCSHDVSTFFHELAHAAHRRVRGELQNGQVASQEIVAETVAATLCKLYGFEAYLYHGARYIGSYANGGNPGKAAMRVLADVQAVLALVLDNTDAKEA